MHQPLRAAHRRAEDDDRVRAYKHAMVQEREATGVLASADRGRQLRQPGGSRGREELCSNRGGACVLAHTNRNAMRRSAFLLRLALAGLCFNLLTASACRGLDKSQPCPPAAATDEQQQPPVLTLQQPVRSVMLVPKV